MKDYPRLCLGDILRRKIPADTFLLERGVYLLIKDDNIVYVGSSKNIPTRIVIHCQEKDFDSFFVIPIEREADMLLLESEYIARFTPKYNMTMPSCARYKFVGLLESSENRKIKIEGVVIGGKVYIDTNF